METLMEFLKHSSTLDLLVILVVVFLTVVLVPIGIAIVIAARRRMPIYLLLIIALLPLLIALVGTYLRFIDIDRALANNPEAGAEIVSAARQEAWITAYLGAAGTAVIELIGVTGLIVKKDRKA
jgi:hypothetical protein